MTAQGTRLFLADPLGLSEPPVIHFGREWVSDGISYKKHSMKLDRQLVKLINGFATRNNPYFYDLEKLSWIKNCCI